MERRRRDTDALDEWLARRLPQPVAFAREVVGTDIWGTQAAILAGLTQHRRTAVKACHASGKTKVASLAVLWWLLRYPDGVVVTTAPTWNQVRKLLWGEIHAALAESDGLKYILGKAQANQTELILGPKNYAVGLSTNEGVNFQGFHGRVLIVLDEAPGVRPDIYEAIEGIRAGGDVRVLALGNPVIGSGPFYDAFTTERERWNLITISAFDTPNLASLDLEALLALPDEALDDNPRPYLTTRRWVREKHADWGEASPLWQSRVLGNFPVQSADALIALGWIDAAINADPVDCAEPYEAGIDVAGPGEDETAVYVRRGPAVLASRAWAQPDPRGEVAAMLGEWKARGQLRVKVDTIGQGYYFGKHLEDMGFDVEHVNVAEAADDKEKYANRKAELYWALRMRFAAGEVQGRLCDRTQAQLTSLRFRHDARGRVVIESKDEARKRGVASPDRAEALMLAFAPVRHVAAAPIGGTQVNYWGGV